MTDQQVRVEVLFRDGSMLVGCGERSIECRAAASVEGLADEEHGLAAPVPWRDAACREAAVRAVASDGSLDGERRRMVAEHAAGAPVLDLDDAPTVVVQFVDPPDWRLAERLGPDFWDRGAPAGWLCATTARVGDGAVADCSNAGFGSAEEREATVRRVASDQRLRPDERRALAIRIAKSPIVTSG